METNSLKALALKVLKRNSSGNIQETGEKNHGNFESEKFPTDNHDGFQFSDATETSAKVFRFDDPYRNIYISIDGCPMFINFCSTHIRTNVDGFQYMTVVPLTLESSTGLIRVHEWATFRVTDQNQMAGLYENNAVRIKT